MEQMASGAFGDMNGAPKEEGEEQSRPKPPSGTGSAPRARRPSRRRHAAVFVYQGPGLYRSRRAGRAWK